VPINANQERSKAVKAGIMALACCTACAALPGCSRDTSTPEPNPLLAPPVDTARGGSLQQAMTWKHYRDLSADLDGDGAPERIVLAADVQSNGRGAPLWEDGHRWALWVEGKGAPTLLYSAFVPNGHAEAAVLGASQDGRRHLLLQERTPQQVRALVVAYDGPGAARTVSAAHYQVERWLPALATPR
jgi:hypothetical protein